MTSENISVAWPDTGDPPTLPTMSPPNPINNDGKNRAMSRYIACCILNLTSRLIDGFPPRMFNAKKAANPEKGMDRYNEYNRNKATTTGLALASSAPSKNLPYCNPSINGNRYGRTEIILSDVVGSLSFKNSNL
eukprot:CAMPEP_0201871716 /NCGR_PEP_ID=MMETSP0902-20130614/4576_1 /ASSEMBLY_ACC=CAM_ASM_000551 /TAXON_ID=420261 /ORGANISM="Thalassiosira antarctica, Strain CCMP982" /LENGTH=133 /DNA_ID=CAMNT_0048397779 /DNA_START=15 /DNA_END=413 /DNA_ORIENTATION=+